MLEATLLCAAAFLLLAAAAHRFRREAGVTLPSERFALRLIAAALLLCATLCCGTPLGGEWSVRFLACASIAATVIVLVLSAAPGPVMAPLRRVMTAVRR